MPTKNAPLACNMAAMTDAQRKQYESIKSEMRASVQEVKELPNGYAFRFKPDHAMLTDLVKFISLESRCCPFYDFAVEVKHDGGAIWLKITGPKAAKSFIKDALIC